MHLKKKKTVGWIGPVFHSLLISDREHGMCYIAEFLKTRIYKLKIDIGHNKKKWTFTI